MISLDADGEAIVVHACPTWYPAATSPWVLPSRVIYIHGSETHGVGMVADSSVHNA